MSRELRHVLISLVLFIIIAAIAIRAEWRMGPILLLGALMAAGDLVRAIWHYIRFKISPPQEDAAV
jgi:hypothetical protein